ncbi:MAG: flagellar type III secretion system protein FliQ [Planctomycetales bacterium]|nr:flagellar type III secretion system protein FliQ [Planctomycetales bacterium]NIM08655.1 flagellar type III secretion system protein FliQ [Planctomycetales bacterium]NIN08125.1 flagellar type III secretion system protein FliQ [Planctomycetales bacterium]NIN77250.1 flagellar type III secretion system protein FliQ [Planctomycetales bacterium]NIO34439.1 flagellar type III secretion system protein FliQ [Planctomycetales bacterium]
MTPEDAIDVGRAAIMMMLLTTAPVLLTGLLVGLVAGFVQAVTQMQEQALAVVPKIVAVALVLILTLPWLVHQLVQFSRELITAIPGNL